MSLNNTNPVETDIIFGLINDIEKYIGQNLTTAVTDKLAKAFNKIYATQGKEVPREVIEFPIHKRSGEKWSLVVAKNDIAEVVCDIYETDKNGNKRIHQERAAVLKIVASVTDNSAASESFIKEAFKARRIHNLVKELGASSGPVEAYNLIADFLGDDYEQEGTVTYKGVRVKYYIGYTTHNEEMLFSLEVKDKQDRNEDPILQFKARFKRDNIQRIYESIKYLVEMHK